MNNEQILKDKYSGLLPPSFIYLFTILYWFFHTLTWICHGCTCVTHPEPTYHLPSHPIPLGHPSAQALSTLYHASNLDWWFISHVIIYMLQCHSPISSHSRPLTQSPKDSFAHLCLFCCLFKCILFNGWIIFHCVYVPQLSYSFICWWTSRLLPCPGYYK